MKLCCGNEYTLVVNLLVFNQLGNSQQVLRVLRTIQKYRNFASSLYHITIFFYDSANPYALTSLNIIQITGKKNLINNFKRKKGK